MPVAYDRAILEKVAARYYDRAAGAEIGYSLLGLLFGVAVSVSLLIAVKPRDPTPGLILAAVLIGLFTMVGHAIGANIALKLRFEAQRTLVLAEIERHLRDPQNP